MSSSSRDYRKRTQRKSTITTIVAVAIIIAALVAIVIVIASRINSNKNDASSGSAASPNEASAATEQPTLYIPTEQGSTAPTAPAASTPTTKEQGDSTQPTVPESTAAPYTPIDPGAIEPTEAPDLPDQTDAPVQDTPSGDLSSYTDDSGVLHVFTPSGYNWTYYYDADCVSIKCDPHYDRGQYEFLITGLKPGNTTFNVYYYTEPDNSKAFVKVPVSAVIDDDLNVIALTVG